MWRPEGWDNPYKQETPEHWSDNYAVIQSKEWHIFEAGADAMLEALFSECEKSGGKWMCFDKTDSGDILIYNNIPQHIVPEE